MNSNLQKKNRSSRYKQPLHVLAKGANRTATNGAGFSRFDARSEAEKIFFSIDWSAAWKEFIERETDGTFKYKTSRDLATAMAVGTDKETRNIRSNCLYWAIGPASNADKSKRVPYLGDWDMLRSQTFLGEMEHDSLLFGAPRMKVMRKVIREHIDVTHAAKGMAEVLLGWLARSETWAQQVDKYFGYTAFDKKLSLKENKKRFDEYMALQGTLRTSTCTVIEQILNCYGVGKGGVDVLAQLMVASKLQGNAAENALQMILAGMSGVQTLDGKATGGSIETPEGISEENHTLKLLTASFADKSITFRMPHPDLHIEGVPDEEEQATPRDIVKKAVREMLPSNGSGKKVQ